MDGNFEHLKNVSKQTPCTFVKHIGAHLMKQYICKHSDEN